MAAQLTVKTVLERAIKREVESQALYNDLRVAMTDPAAKDAFRGLVKQEAGHQRLLEEYKNGQITEGALAPEKAVDYKIADKLEQTEVTPGMKLKDIFLLAANREKFSHAFYFAFAAIHPSGKVKNLLNELAAQELEHKRRVEKLFTEVAFPQTDGG